MEDFCIYGGAFILSPGHTPFIVSRSRRYVMLSYIYIYIKKKKHENEKANYRQDLLMMIIIIILKYKIVLELLYFLTFRPKG